ncbi:MAG: DUF3592 domain-containing protein [Planctomycetaceae bacterium]
MAAAKAKSPLTQTPAMGCGLLGGTVVGCLFFGVFLTVGCAMGYFMVIGPWLKMQEAASWKPTPCLIDECELGVHRGDDNDSYSIDVVYSYEVNGQKFTAERYSFFDMNSNSRDWRKKVVNELQPGTETVCFVDPDDPQEAVIHRGWTPDWPWSFFPIPFFLVGFLGVLGVAYNFLTGGSLANSTLPQGGILNRGAMQSTGDMHSAGEGGARTFSSGSISSWSESDYDDDDVEEASGPVTLASESAPLATAIFLLIFGLIWNGIVSVFVAQRVPEWMQFKFGFIDLFLTPFILVGIGTILGALHQFLASFNPVPILTLSRQWIPLGSDAKLSWQFRGSPRSIRTLRITLEGREEARYRRGTNTSTDTNVFFTEVLHETSDPFEMAEGKDLLIPIPTDSMHSFDGGNNKIIWRLKFHGEIPFWPDVTADFPIRVMPHE